MPKPSIVQDRDPGRRAPRAGPELVRLERVGKTFANGTVALQGLDLVIGEHEFLCLLGPSGCGKSTVLRLLAGLGRAERRPDRLGRRRGRPQAPRRRSASSSRSRR